MGEYGARTRATAIGAMGLAAAPTLRSSNLPRDPSGVRGSTTGWYAPSG